LSVFSAQVSVFWQSLPTWAVLWYGAICPKFQSVFLFIDVVELQKIHRNCNSITKYKLLFRWLQNTIYMKCILNT